MACVAAMTALRSLDIAGCSMVSAPGVAAVAAALTDLRELRVGGASRMSHIQDDAVAALAVASRLTSLDLSGCLNLSDAGPLLSLAQRDAFKCAQGTWYPRFEAARMSRCGDGCKC
jgi:hypothetical protein